MWEFILFIVALVAFITLCIRDCEDRREEDSDEVLCRKIGIVIAALVMLCNSGIKPDPITIRPTTISFWNRNTRLIKGRWEVTHYRHPEVQLSAADYMMGVELAKSGACSFFDLSRDSEIDRLKRCFHFFPDMRQEFESKYQDQVGFCI